MVTKTPKKKITATDDAVEIGIPRLIPTDSVEPAVYNPRETDPQRLQLLQLSLKKLGFILPLYAQPNGHLLSGHQRKLASELLGLTHIPVVHLNVPDKKTRNINISFNRSTNDMRATDTSDQLFEQLNMEDLYELAASVPDKDPSNEREFYRCLYPTLEPINELVKLKMAPYEGASVSSAQTLMDYKVFMPIIVNESGEITNGTYRLLAAADEQSRWKHEKHLPKGLYPVVRVSDAEAKLAAILMNMISMKFTLENQYADDLRFGAFRRPSNYVPDLVRSLSFWPDGGVSKMVWDSLKNPQKFWDAFRRENGASVLDFGAGQRITETLLVKKGIPCTSWEPYPCPQADDPERVLAEAENRAGQPDLALARRLTDNLLYEVANGTKWECISLSAVLNSVPFEIDRRYVLLICNALSSWNTRCIGSVRHIDNLKSFTKRVDNRLSSTGGTSRFLSMFSLDYEPGLAIGEVSANAKVQKFHSVEEAKHLLGMFYAKVEIKAATNYIFFRASCPKRVRPELLKKALLEEFNLPYKGGESIGRGQAALEAFGKRLNINFAEVPDV